MHATYFPSTSLICAALGADEKKLRRATLNGIRAAKYAPMIHPDDETPDTTPARSSSLAEANAFADRLWKSSSSKLAS